MEFPATRRVAAPLCFFLATTALVVAAAGAPGRANLSARYCRPSETDHRARALAPALAPLAQKLFGFAPPPGSAFYRCAKGHLLVCAIGANEPCGRADVNRVMASAAKFCRNNPGSRFIPMVVTGHDTIYAWRCVGRIATPGAPVAKVDKQGFFISTWKKAN